MVVSLTYVEDGNHCRWFLRRGEQAVLGTSPWCDFVLPSKENDSFVSCTLHLGKMLFVAADSDLQIHNTLKDSISLHSNDTFQLKHYPIEVTFLGHSEPISSTEESGESDGLSANKNDVESSASSALWFDYVSVPKIVLMSESGQKLFLSVDSPLRAIDLLVANDLLEDAMRGLAGMLPLQNLLNWCIAMLDTSAIEIAPTIRILLKQWQSNPMGVSKNQLASMVNWSDNTNPWTHLLAAVSWIEPNGNSSLTWCTNSTLQMIVASVIASLQLATSSVKAEPFRRACIGHGLQLLHLSLNDFTSGGMT